MGLSGKIYAFLYGILGIFLFLYSYTQVDLGMTLTQASIWQSIQKWFQHVGYFNRPLSTGIYLVLLFFLFLFYSSIIRLIQRKQISSKRVWLIIIVIAITTVFSYPAFSYDFFNYLFTAKTVLIYHANPYQVIPLQFAGIDPWLSFMHWTHQPSAYTPLWILLTLVPYLFGFGYFLLLLWNLKLLLAGAYLATILGIGKLLEKEDKDYALLGVAIFALNPLVIIECLISSHNDIVMMALAVWAMVVYKQKKILFSWILLSLSAAMKLMTIFLIPAFFTKWKRLASFICIIIGFIAVLLQREVLSWYWVWIMPFIALLPRNKALWILSYSVSIGLLLRYAPFLYFGNWDNPVPIIKTWVTLIPVGAGMLLAGLELFRVPKDS